MPFLGTIGGGSSRGHGRGLGGGAGLYPFTTVTFTPGGATSKTGPTLEQVRSGITGNNDWKNNTLYLNTRGTNGGIIVWTVPATGTYRMNLYGAAGGRDTYQSGQLGGYGARIQGDFSLEAGTILNIVVGQKGQDDPGWSWGGAGGGGSFVWVQNSNAAPLIAAGGGGGGGQSRGSNSHGQTGTSGGYGSNGASGGTGGNAGGAGSGICGGGNGQGWFGGTTYSCGGNFVWPALYDDPTGRGGYDGGNSQGGFGGGAHSYGGAGGGGGYSGGGSGGWSYSYSGGGGGSYNAGSNPVAETNNNSGTGSVIITKL